MLPIIGDFNSRTRKDNTGREWVIAPSWCRNSPDEWQRRTDVRILWAQWVSCRRDTFSASLYLQTDLDFTWWPHQGSTRCPYQQEVDELFARSQSLQRCKLLIRSQPDSWRKRGDRNWFKQVEGCTNQRTLEVLCYRIKVKTTVKQGCVFCHFPFH